MRTNVGTSSRLFSNSTDFSQLKSSSKRVLIFEKTFQSYLYRMHETLRLLITRLTLAINIEARGEDTQTTELIRLELVEDHPSIRHLYMSLFIKQMFHFILRTMAGTSYRLFSISTDF